MTAEPTNSHYKLRAALRLYDLFHTCENLLEVQPHPENVNLQQTGINNIEKKRPKTSGNNAPPNNPETNQKQSLTNNISLATITNNELLAAIFSFKFKETTPVPLFSGAILDTKPIITMYTDAKVDGHFIKLILDNRSAGSIITKQLMDQLDCQIDRTASAKIITANGATKNLIGEIDDFLIEVNSIIIPIKVLIMEATQYQALIGNDWLSKINASLD
ncbi:hypothetical protein G9A89_017458 [Geosiphon pyriformis]|nr:hypothetical protein G9A89_017458 [Geosiphon pyriformis]